MSVHDIRYAYSLKSDASCLNGAPRAPTQCQTFAEMLMYLMLLSLCSKSRVNVLNTSTHTYFFLNLLHYVGYKTCCPNSVTSDQTVKGKRLLHGVRDAAHE